MADGDSSAYLPLRKRMLLSSVPSDGPSAPVEPLVAVHDATQAALGQAPQSLPAKTAPLDEDSEGMIDVTSVSATAVPSSPSTQPHKHADAAAIAPTSRTAAEGDEPEEVYCICRTNREGFMIQCDACTEWFHGKCIGLLKRDSQLIENFYCEACIAQDPSRSIVYKTGAEGPPQKRPRVQQCHRPSCGNLLPAPANRKKRTSKYCSRECGLMLARSRLDLLVGDLCGSSSAGDVASIKTELSGEGGGLMPAPGTAQWLAHTMSSRANEMDAAQLSELSARRAAAEAAIVEAEEALQRVLENVAAAATLPPSTDGKDADSSADARVSCVLCTESLSMGQYGRHVDKCVFKGFAPVSFSVLGGFPRFHRVHEFMCDVRDPASGAICAKPRTICWAHNKEQPWLNNAVVKRGLKNAPCGFREEDGSVCTRSKCVSHYEWELTSRILAEYELFDKYCTLERILREAELLYTRMERRAHTTLATLLNQTTAVSQ